LLPWFTPTLSLAVDPVTIVVIKYPCRSTSSLEEQLIGKNIASMGVTKAKAEPQSDQPEPCTMDLGVVADVPLGA